MRVARRRGPAPPSRFGAGRVGTRAFAAVAALTLLLLAVVVFQLRSGDGSGHSPSPRATAVSELRVINYYPSDAGWGQMWTGYSHERTLDDFRAVAALDANTVRIFVHAYTFGYPAPRPQMQQHLDDLLATARSVGLRVQLSLFDWWGDYRDVRGSLSWVDDLLTPHRGDPTIAMVELRNELPADDPAAIGWAHALLPELARVLPGVPRTLSLRGTSRAEDVKTFFDQFPRSQLDVLSVHFYGATQELPSILAAAEQAAGGRPVLVGELGYSTLPQDGVAGEQAQADYFRAVAKTLRAAGLPPFAPWILTDFVAGAVPGRAGQTPREYHFGLRRTDGSEKPAAEVVRQMFAGSGL